MPMNLIDRHKSHGRSCPVTGVRYSHGSLSHLSHLYWRVSLRFEDLVLRALLSSFPTGFQWFGGILRDLDLHVSLRVKGPGFEDTLRHFERKCLRLGRCFQEAGRHHEARQLYLQLYQSVRTAELSCSKHFHKGAILWFIGSTEEACRRNEDATNWFFLAMLEDLRWNPTGWRQLPARDSLVTSPRLAQASVDSIGDEAMTICVNTTWSPMEPESVWLEILPHRRRFSCAPLLFIHELAVRLAAPLEEEQLNKNEKGKALESLMTYFFACEPGFEVLGSTLAPDAQHDVLVRNRHEDAILHSLGDYLLVECKNWANAVNSATVRELAGRLHAAGIKTGVLVTTKGITGGSEKRKRTAARLTIGKEYLQDRTAILVIDKSMIDRVVAGTETLASLLLSAFEDVRFDRM